MLAVDLLARDVVHPIARLAGEARSRVHEEFTPSTDNPGTSQWYERKRHGDSYRLYNRSSKSCQDAGCKGVAGGAKPVKPAFEVADWSRIIIMEQTHRKQRGISRGSTVPIALLSRVQYNPSH